MGISHDAVPDLVIIRTKRGVSLEEIAASTKIAVSYLRAIEEGVFDKLPGGIYTVSYIRQYARAIDYDEDGLVRHYYRVSGVQPPDAATAAPKRDSSPLARLARVLG